MFKLNKYEAIPNTLFGRLHNNNRVINCLLTTLVKRQNIIETE